MIQLLWIYVIKKKGRIGKIIAKMQRTCCTTWRCRERRFRLVCSVFWVRIFHVIQDSRQSSGEYFQTLQIQRTRNSCRIDLHIQSFWTYRMRIPQIFIRLSNIVHPNSRVKIQNPVMSLEIFLNAYSSAELQWKRQFEILIENGWDIIPNYELLIILNEMERKSIWIPRRTNWWKKLISENQLLSWINYTLGVRKRMQVNFVFHTRKQRLSQSDPMWIHDLFSWNRKTYEDTCGKILRIDT